MSTLAHIADLPAELPPCPNCGEDELSLIQENRATCCACSCIVIRRIPGLHILDIAAPCRDCPWTGTIAECDVSDNGDLHCPQCGNELVIRLAKEPTQPPR